MTVSDFAQNGLACAISLNHQLEGTGLPQGLKLKLDMPVCLHQALYDAASCRDIHGLPGLAGAAR